MDQEILKKYIDLISVFDEGPLVNVIPDQYQEQVDLETARIMRAIRNGTYNEDTWDFPDWWIEITGRDWDIEQTK